MAKKTSAGSKGKAATKSSPKQGSKTTTGGKVRSYSTGSTGPKGPAKKGK